MLFDFAGFFTTKRLGIAVIVSVIIIAGQSGGTAAESVDYNRDIRPILSDNCFRCHGPDEGERQTEWRLDLKESALGLTDSGETAIVPYNSDESAIYQRISAEDEFMRMPPADSGKSLTDEQIELIRRWIDQGASWEEHWAFRAPIRPEIPAAAESDWPKNEIDEFVLQALHDAQLGPEPEADRTTLIRRLTFDLTGLPPTLDEVDAFLADDSPGAYERLVDRLLKSPRYGEHMARYWLDAARYGDTHGLHLDNFRMIWPYRNWVINAFNDNMPFDEFTVQQLAGDLLPEPSLDQIVATGFNRCNVSTSEGGSIDQEYYVRYAVDRVDTTSTVFMGLTMGCAVCHDHKYDPLSQKEFYQLFSYFYSLTEKAMDGNAKDPPPVVKVPTPEQRERLAALRSHLAATEEQMYAPVPELDKAQAEWERSWSRTSEQRWQPMASIQFSAAGGAAISSLEDGSLLVAGENPDTTTYEFEGQTYQTGVSAIRLEALTHESFPKNGPGRSGNGNFVLTEFEAEVSPLENPQHVRQVRFRYALADFSQEKFPIENAIDGKTDKGNGWAVQGDKKHEDRTSLFVADEPIGFPGGTIIRIRLRHESQFPQHAIGRFRLSLTSDASFAPSRQGPWYAVGPFEADDGYKAFDRAFPPEEGVDLESKYADGKLSWTRQDFADGEVHNLSGNRCATYLYRTIHAPSQRSLELSLGSDDALKVWLNDVLVHTATKQRTVAPGQERISVELRPGENRLLMKVANYDGGYGFYYNVLKEQGNDEILKIEPVLNIAESERTESQRRLAKAFFRKAHAPEWRDLERQLTELRREEREIEESIPTTLVMQEREEPRQAHLLIRGEYDRPGDPVGRGVPAVLPPLPEGAPNNRLGLARWLVDPSHPLTARVTVNRFWQHYFGTGIVKTSEDFGSQGEWPSHPELLDWLAVEFIDSGWDVKEMHKKIVMSAAYRQSSRITPEKLAVDPENRLISRGPRFRLDAEMVRDNALAISGLLVDTIGGPSVKPYQPPGLWYAVGYTSSNTAKFQRDDRDALYRRSMYTFWKRTSPPPTMALFDAPSREACTVRRPRTNTPLQALALMNDVQHMEAARKFAERILNEGGSETRTRAEFAFRLATARRPSNAELEIVIDSYRRHLDGFKADAKAAQELLTNGESPHNSTFPESELAAWTMVANMILNLHETITKG